MRSSADAAAAALGGPAKSGIAHQIGLVEQTKPVASDCLHPGLGTVTRTVEPDLRLRLSVMKPHGEVELT